MTRIRYSLTALFIAALLPAILLIPGIHTEDHLSDMTVKSKKLWRQGFPLGHPGMRELYYQQRLFGSEGINLGQKIWQEYQSHVATNSNSMMKGASLSAQWKEEGPWNYGGRMRGIAFNPVNTNIIYAAAANGGVWKSTNLGLEWRAVTDNFPVLSIGAVAVDPNNPNVVFAGTGEPDVFTNTASTGQGNGTPIYGTSIGVLKSVDGGENWSLLSFGGSTGGVHRIAVSSAHSDTLLVATTSGIQKTTDGGASWQTVLGGVGTDVLLKPGSTSRVYAAIGDDRGSSASGVYVSDAGGGRFLWRKLTTNFPQADSCGRIILAISAANADRIYAAVAMNRNRIPGGAPNDDFNVLMVSNNGGETWERKMNAISKSFTSGQAYYDFALAVSPSDPNMVFLGGLEVHRSTNGGTNFSLVTDGSLNEENTKYVHVDIHAFAFKPDDGNTMLVGGDGGVSITTNGGLNWQRRVNRLGTIQYYGINYDPANPRNLFGGTQDNGTHAKFSSDNTQWLRFYGGDGGNVYIDPTSNSIRYVTSLTIDQQTQNLIRVLIRYTTAQPNGVRLDRGLNPGVDRWTWLPPVVLHPLDRTRLYTATQFVYVLKNPHTGTPTWAPISPDIAQFGIITDLAISEKNGDWMYTISNRGNAHISKNISSIDPIWTNISNGLPSRWLTDVTVDWDDPSTAYVSASGFGTGHAFKTTNAGQTWVDISGNLPDISAGAIIRSRTDANTIFLGTDLGVWVTTNGGSNWSQLQGMPNAVVFDMKLSPDNTLIVGTHGRGFWTTSSILSTDKFTTPSSVHLGQNYPNPFNPSTTIPYRLSKRQHASLKIYNTNGLLIHTVFDGMKEEGEHSAVVSSESLRSGTYFYTLTTGTQSITKKMVVLK